MTGTNNALLKSAWKLRVIKHDKAGDFWAICRTTVIHETPISKERAEELAVARFPFDKVEVINE